MNPSSAWPVSVLLYGLDDELASGLARAASGACETLQVAMAASRKQSADVVFCQPCSNTVRELKLRHPAASVIVASRLPDVSDWLDALDAGAADYCAAPFEPAQIRWLLESHVRASA